MTIIREDRLGATVEIAQDEWTSLRFVLVTLRGGREVAEAIDVHHRSSSGWLPFTVRLRRAQLDLLEAAYARIC